MPCVRKCHTHMMSASYCHSVGHAECVDFVRSLNVPLLILGGGGYTVRNVARCWAYETGIVLGEKIPSGKQFSNVAVVVLSSRLLLFDASAEIPYNEFYEYYGPDFNLHITPSNMENLNTQRYLEKNKYVRSLHLQSASRLLTPCFLATCHSFFCYFPGKLCSKFFAIFLTLRVFSSKRYRACLWSFPLLRVILTARFLYLWQTSSRHRVRRT